LEAQPEREIAELSPKPSLLLQFLFLPGSTKELVLCTIAAIISWKHMMKN
jgi:hypothetical protein